MTLFVLKATASLLAVCSVVAKRVIERELFWGSLFTLEMNAMVHLDIPADTFASTRMTMEDIRLELAIVLFKLDRLSMGKAAEFAQLPVGVFQSYLAARKIGPHYDVADALDDAETLAALPH